MGIVLQELAVEPFLSVRQVLTRNAGYYPHPRPVDEVLELVGLAEKAAARVKTLSGGQQRRLDVGLGIIGQPELLFLDEPTTGLDPSGRRATWDLIRQLGGRGHDGAPHQPLHGRGRGAGRPGGGAGRRADRGQRNAGLDRRAGHRRGDDPVPAARRGVRRAICRCPPSQPAAARSRSGPRTRSRCCTTLTGWALGRDVGLPGLTVRRVTLEDVYLQLTREPDEPGRTRQEQLR